MSRTRGGCRADTRKLPPATARAHHDKPQEAFMDLRKIKKLIDLLEESNLAEIEIKEGEESVRLARTPSGGAPMAYAPAPAYAEAPRAPQPLPLQSPVDPTGRAPRRDSMWQYG